MKNQLYLHFLALGALLLCAAPPAARANDIKANTASMAANAANWLTADPGNGGTGLVPATTDVGEFDATISGANIGALSLGGATLVLGGLQFDTTVNGPAVITDTATLAIGTSGLTINTNVTLNAPYRSGVVQTWTVAPNSTLNLNGTVLLDESSSSANEDPYFPTSGTQVLTITGGGTVNVPNAVLEPNYTGSGTGIASASGLLITGGTFNGLGITIERSVNSGTAYPTIGGPFVAPTTAGFVVSGASTVVNLGSLTIGGGFANNPASANIEGGATTVTNAVLVGDTAGNSNPQRWGVFEVSGGSFTSLDTVTGFVIAQSDGGVYNPMEVYFAGGVSTIAKMLIGSPQDPANATNRTAIFIKGGTLYLGSQGLALGNSSPNNVPYAGNNGYLISLYSGILGASASWSSSLAMTLSGTTPAFTIQTADAANNPHNITLSGVLSDGGSGAPLNITGGGVLTLSGANTFGGILSLNGGTINAGSAESVNVSGPFGKQLANAAGTILFGGGTLQYSAANHNDYSGRFDNSLGDQPISIDTAGQNVTFATAIVGTGTSLTVNDTVGGGSLTLTGASTYDTGTFVNSGTLNVNNTSGSGTGSGAVTVAGTGVLGGSGTIGGNVVVNSGGTTLPGQSGVTTTIAGNLTYNAGSSAAFDLAASASGPGNDEIVLSGAGSTLNCGGVVTINVTGAGLDLANNYVLFNVPSGTIAGAFNSVPNFTGTPLAHPNFYSVQTVGSQVLLVVSAVTPPNIANQTATPSSIEANQSVTITATVTQGQYPLSTVVVNLSALGLSPTQSLTNTTGSTWTATVTAADSATPGNDALGITATDTHGTSTTVPVALTVTAAPGTTETWNGSDFANSLNWSDPANWASGLAPGFGDNIYFGGSVTGPVMNGSYSLAGVTFNSAAGAFNLTGSGTLTVTAGVTNNSTTAQTVSVPVALGASSVTINDANAAGVVLAGAISGPSLDALTTTGNVTLSGANTFAGATVPAGGNLILNNTLALQDSTLSYNAGTVSFGTLTSASIGALTGSKNLALENSTPAAVALTIGGNNTSQSFSGGLTDTGNGSSLTVSGTGVQTFLGVSTYSGATTINAGSSLILGGASQLGGGTYSGAIANNGVFTYNSTANQTLGGIISGSGGLTDTGSGTLTLSGVNTYSGVTSIAAGAKLTLGGAGLLGGGNYSKTITDNGTLTYSSSASQTLSGTLSGSGALTVNGTGTLALNSANPAFTGSTTVSAGTLQINNSSALQNNVLTLSGGSVTVGNNVTLVNLGGLSGTSSSANLALVDAGNPVTLSVVNGAAHSFAGIISDGGLGGSLSVGGAGQTLTGTNTYSGSTTVNSGTLTVGGAGKLGGGNYAGNLSVQTGSTFTWASSAPQTLGGEGFEGGGSVQVTGTGVLTTVSTNALNGGGTFTIATNATFAIAGGGQMLGANYAGAYSEAETLNGTLNFASSNNTTLSGAISGSYGKINVNGLFTGTLTLSGANTYTSNTITTLNSGILAYGNDGAAGVAPASPITNIFFNGGDLLGSGSFTLNANRTLAVGLTNAVVGTNALIDSGGVFTIAGAIVSGNTNKNGLVINAEGNAGTVVLAGASTYTGNTTIDAGFLQLSPSGSINYSTNIIVENGGTFDLSQLAAYTLAPNQNLLGSGSVNSPSSGYFIAGPGSSVTGGTNNGTYGTLTFDESLTLALGSVCSLNLGTVYNQTNDLIQVDQNLVLDSPTFQLAAPSTSVNLDTTADYTLINTSSGISGAVNSKPVWTVAPLNAAYYSVAVVGNAVNLHYNTSIPPSLTATVSPTTVSRTQSILVTATVTPGGNPVNTVTVDTTLIGGAPGQALVEVGATSVYTNTFLVSGTSASGTFALPVTVTDSASITGTAGAVLSVLPSQQVWDGASSVDANWSDTQNWASRFAPQNGDSVAFAGSTQLAPNMDNNYSLTSVTFNSGAGAFDIGSQNSDTLNLLGAGSVTNNSVNPETLNVAISLNLPATFNTAAGNIIVSQAISDTGDGLVEVGPHTLILSSYNNYTGGTTIGVGGTVEIADPGNLNSGTYAAGIVDGGTFYYNSSSMQTLSGVISGPGGLVFGNGVVNGELVLSGANSFTGNVVINQGTVSDQNEQNNNYPAVSGLGDPQIAGRTVTINNGGILSLDASGGNEFGGGSVSNLLGIVINAGGLMQITSGNATIGPVTLNGGTMDSSSAASVTAQYGAYEFSGAITVGGTTPSTIQSEVSAIYNLTVNSFVPNGIFNVTNVNGLLNVTAALGNSGGSQTAAGLLKTGPGTLALYAANLYTGSTTVSNGTLLVANTNGITGSISNGPVYIAGGTLGGNGIIYGAVTNQAGGTLEPGAGTSSPGTMLTLSNNLTLLAGSTTVLQVEHFTTPDQVTSGGTITYGGILMVVTNAQDSTAFQVGDTFTLFNKTGAGAFKAGSSFASIQPPPGPGLGWSGANLTVNGSIQVVAASPVSAGFSWGPATGAQPLTVNFTNLSSGANYWIWNYGDGNTLSTFGATNVSHVYPNIGTYTVILTAYGTGGVSSVTNIAAVVVLPPPPVAAFSASPTNVFLTQAVTFTDASTGSITNWVWSLGDNTFVTNSSNASVVHTYAATGTYTVSLTVSGAGGANTSTRTSYVGVVPRTSLGVAAPVNGKLVFSGANGPAGQKYRILSTTNLTLPLANWTPVWTNTFAANGGFSYTNSAPTNQAGFYLMVSP